MYVPCTCMHVFVRIQFFRLMQNLALFLSGMIHNGQNVPKDPTCLRCEYVDLLLTVIRSDQILMELCIDVQVSKT